MEQSSGILVPYLSAAEAAGISGLSAQLDGLLRTAIEFAPWPGHAAPPRVSFAMAYGSGHIYLKYYVAEASVKAEYLNFNDPVYKDSCVEFFIAFNGDENYYNLEFNCIGNCLAQYGPGKEGRTFLPPQLLRTIKHEMRMTSRANQAIEWEMTLAIPMTLFHYQPLLSLESCRARGNFYKCGEDLPEPHYLCWSNISAEDPEFHLPNFFEEIRFEKRSDGLESGVITL
jgi:hypothetical protein